MAALPESSGGQVAVGAAGGRAGAGAAEDADQRAGRGADHGLQVEAVVRQGRQGQGPLAAGAGSDSGTGELGPCRGGIERKGMGEGEGKGGCRHFF